MTNVAVDAVFDSVSIATTFRADLLKHGVIFCSISEALHEYPELVKKYMGSVVSSFCACALQHLGACIIRRLAIIGYACIACQLLACLLGTHACFMSSSAIRRCSRSTPRAHAYTRPQAWTMRAIPCSMFPCTCTPALCGTFVYAPHIVHPSGPHAHVLTYICAGARGRQLLCSAEQRSVQ